MPRCVFARWKPLLVMEDAIREDAVIVALLEPDNAEFVLAPNNHPGDSMCAFKVRRHGDVDNLSTVTSTFKRILRDQAHDLVDRRAAGAKTAR